jgi:hypothetical protein
VTNSRITVDLGPIGHNGKIELDGKDISKYVRSVTVTATAGEFTKASLELTPVAVRVRGNQIQAVVSPELEEILEALGWTPPGSCAQGCR